MKLDNALIVATVLVTAIVIFIVLLLVKGEN